MWVRSNLGKDGEEREGVAIDGFKDPEGQTLTWQDSVMRNEEWASWGPMKPLFSLRLFPRGHFRLVFSPCPDASAVASARC